MRDTLLREDMVRPGETVVVAVSGGLDSMCLLDLMVRAAGELGLALVVAHVHHGLRGREADRDLGLVESRASGYGLRFEKVRLERESYGAGGNLQARARELRYAFLEKTAGTCRARRIATGHHRDDQVETLLMQLFRGTGSLRGIPVVREGRYIRPLMDLGRAELARYAAAREIPYREDESNRNPVFLRNRIRAELLPYLRARVNPSVERALDRFSRLLRQDGECLDQLARAALDRAALPEQGAGRVVMRRSVVAGLHPAIRGRVLRLAFSLLTGSPWGLGHAQVQGVSRFLGDAPGGSQRRFRLAGGVHVFAEPGELILAFEDLWSCRPYRRRVSVGEAVGVPEAGGTLLVRWVPCGPDLLEAPRGAGEALLAWGGAAGSLWIRNPRPGDRFRPLGLGGEKKLKEFFIDRKIPRSQRVRMPLLEIAGEIAWVVGQQVGERFRLTGAEESCLKVEWTAAGRNGALPPRPERKKTL